ncbi:hypothetical protein VHUM_02691 [Vanrija humicola]|uniref:Protein PBN1 n=1 Tax=Vanrija humicola TaxID=5417 RepID=A0A7D8V129_VANHU|nr:hypothetical protein VHUM_02691 [Vanrija humicola]
MRLSYFLAVLSISGLAAAQPSPPPDTFHESLTLHPLPDGKLSVLFEFTTHFSLHGGASTAQSHHTLTPPALLLPIEKNNVSELTVSFTSGQWHQDRHGEVGPLEYEAGGGGAEVRGWLANGPTEETDERWDAVTKAFGGLFCAGVGAEHVGESVRTFGHLYAPARQNLTHYYVSNPHLHLCTENLTPFLSLLPSKGVSGLSSLLAQPGVVLAWGFKTEGIDVVMPTETEQGTWRGWWEGVVDLVPIPGASRQHSINSLFKKPLPRPFPLASSSVLKVIAPSGGFSVEPGPNDVEGKWIDGTRHEEASWDLLVDGVAGHDIKFWFNDEAEFVHPQHFEPPLVTISRVAANRYASDATFVVEITNHADADREVTYSEIWPWWVKGWLSEMSVTVKGDATKRNDLIQSFEYNPSTPPLPSTTTLHIGLTLPARATTVITIPFTKLTLKYTDHRPDAERGREIPASVLTFHDIEGEADTGTERADGVQSGTRDFRRSARRRIFGPKLLLDVPVPDFSMPYNVIIMTSTIMAVFFGSIQGRLIRRWGWVKKSKGGGDSSNNKAKLE